MRKGLQVISLLVVYALATWGLRGLGWAPPPLVTPQVVVQLTAPWSPAPRTRDHQGPSRVAQRELIAAGEALVAPPSSNDALLAAAVASGSAVADSPVPDRHDPGSWQAFLAKLRDLEAGRRDKVRVLQLGDSELVADGTSAALRRAMAERFGLGGLGFSLAMLPLPWYQHEHWRHEEGRSVAVFAYPYGKLQSGQYGPGGVSFEATPGARAEVRLSHPVEGPCRLQFFFGYLPQGGEVKLLADGFALTTVDTARWRPGMGMVEIARPRCPTKLSLVTSKRYTRLYGWSIEYDVPGVVWSSLGVVGAKMAQLAHYEDGHLAESLGALSPDLVVMTFGLNLAAMRWPPPPSYRAEAERILRRLRSGLPDAACLVTGPYPVGYPNHDGRFVPEAESAKVIGDYQRQAAEAAGCTFLDRFRLSGGAPAAKRWVATHPKILAGDYQHLTVEGSNRMGRAIADVILASYDEVAVDANAFALEHRGEGR